MKYTLMCLIALSFNFSYAQPEKADALDKENIVEKASQRKETEVVQAEVYCHGIANSGNEYHVTVSFNEKRENLGKESYTNHLLEGEANIVKKDSKGNTLAETDKKLNAILLQTGEDRSFSMLHEVIISKGEQPEMLNIMLASGDFPDTETSDQLSFDIDGIKGSFQRASCSTAILE